MQLPSSLDAATAQTYLTRAIAAFDKLMTGAAVVEVDIVASGGGYKTRFTPANREALESYIAALEERVAGTCDRRGAIGIVF